MRVADFIQLLKHLLLQCQILEHRFNDEIRSFQVLPISGCLEVGEESRDLI